MGAVERFIVKSVKDTGLDKIAGSLLGEQGSTGQDARLVSDAIDAAAKATRYADDVELRLTIDYKLRSLAEPS